MRFVNFYFPVCARRPAAPPGRMGKALALTIKCSYHTFSGRPLQATVKTGTNSRCGGIRISDSPGISVETGLKVATVFGKYML